jgi:hypothetical protein
MVGMSAADEGWQESRSRVVTGNRAAITSLSSPAVEEE